MPDLTPAAGYYTLTCVTPGLHVAEITTRYCIDWINVTRCTTGHFTSPPIPPATVTHACPGKGRYTVPVYHLRTARLRTFPVRTPILHRFGATAQRSPAPTDACHYGDPTNSPVPAFTGVWPVPRYHRLPHTTRAVTALPATLDSTGDYVIPPLCGTLPLVGTC